ncbi:20S proteasome A and B subunits [Segniliparus rotundus DSM 44985]|uniref:Proteasome subunit beta n=1 Tax=Segniliparus rotundus (strain ATCC BAA-972 / CDC 1076 / CIP 108378 / DSM 44985 / JCM 13578) TaxID=640132 RepID=D6Z7Y3_SEGRD|nr:proteasome subunit beta [Segniliparus rotundus]ADG98063.1 20S proteasome A and B subunits [Segniliparus rotundus DSM 44985]
MSGSESFSVFSQPQFSSSFTEHLRASAPQLLPYRQETAMELPVSGTGSLPHATTIVALTYAGGVLIAGDRRATSGNLISHDEMQKVYLTDEYSAAGIAGTVAIAFELVRLFTVELEHYEKVEGVALTFSGKANRLAAMVRGNLDAAMQGLAAVPLLIGLDPQDPEPKGRIVSYDAAGGRFEESSGYHCIGSGGLFARSTLKRLHDPDADRATALRSAVEALADAGEADSATAGPNFVKRIWPTAIRIEASGGEEVPESEIAEVAEAVLEARRRRA